MTKFDQVEIEFSEQAELILEKMPNLSREEIFEWFITKRKIFIGGGDLITFLQMKKKEDSDNNKKD